ncbi:hypothetical protein ABPG72_016141 [Tetrahymena utriculariae]
MDQTELYSQNIEQPNSINQSEERPDSLYFEQREHANSQYGTNTNAIFGSSIKKISSNILLDSELAKNFSEDFKNLYKEACRQTDNYTMRDERLQERISIQGRVARFSLYIKAIFMAFLPILITGFETFSTVKYITSCSLNGVEQPLSVCVSCNQNSYTYDISLTYNILLYIFWISVVAAYYFFFFCMKKESNLIMGMFSFQIKVIGHTLSALKYHWIGFSLYTFLLCLAVILNKIVRLYADQDNQNVNCPSGISLTLKLTGDNYTTAQYITSLILTVLFSIESYKMLIKLAVEPSYSYLSSQKVFHTSYSSDTAYIMQQISKITKELEYSKFAQVLQQTALEAKVNFKLPFTNEYVREAILMVIVLKINRDKLYLQGS